MYFLSFGLAALLRDREREEEEEEEEELASVPVKPVLIEKPIETPKPIVNEVPKPVVNEVPKQVVHEVPKPVVSEVPKQVVYEAPKQEPPKPIVYEATPKQAITPPKSPRELKPIIKKQEQRVYFAEEQVVQEAPTSPTATSGDEGSKPRRPSVLKGLKHMGNQLLIYFSKESIRQFAYYNTQTQTRSSSY